MSKLEGQSLPARRSCVRDRGRIWTDMNLLNGLRAGSTALLQREDGLLGHVEVRDHDELVGGKREVCGLWPVKLFH